MARVITKIGDVFMAQLDGNGKKYFQYIANDLTMLNSSVIRTFRKRYPADAKPDLQEVVADEVDFYAHVVIKWGIKMSLWEKAGKVPFSGKLDVLFRDSQDYGSGLGTSYNWLIWKVNEEQKYVGKLGGEHQRAEIGVVVAPVDIVERMRTGKYRYVHPGY